MKQLVNLFGRQVKNQATEIVRRPARRTLRSETLEPRQLLAGDILAGHNYSIPEDVNGDWKVTPLDAILIINEIRRSGGALDLDGIQADEIEHFYDVAGNNRVTPLDALLVINKIARGEGADVPVLELQLNPRNSLDQEFSASAFDTAKRELTVGVNEVFNLEMTYRDIRSGTRSGLFAAYADILFDPVNAGNLEPVFTETQFLELSFNIETATSGSLAFSLPGQSTPVLIDIQDYFDSPVNQIQNAVRALDFPGAVVTNLTSAGDEPSPFFQIRFNAPNDYSLADLDLPNLIVTPNLSNSSGAVGVTAEVTDIKPRNADGSINVNAVGFNADFRSRTFGANASNPSGLEFYGAGGTGVGRYDVTQGFLGVGGVGEAFRDGISPFPFDVFSVPVRMTEATTGFEIFVAPPSTPGSGNIFYRSDSEIPDYKILINRDLASGGSGVVFVTAVADPSGVSLTAGNGSLTAVQNGGAVSSDLRGLVTVTPDNSVTPTFVVENQGTRGTASFNGSSVSYTPTSGQVGTDTFTYRASFGGQSAVGTITVTINPAATTVVATNGSLTAVQNGAAVPLNLRPLVTVGPDNSVTPTFTATNGAKGTTTIDGTTVGYTPAAGAVGTDSFTYTATFNGVSSTATINVTINPAAPSITAGNDSLVAVQNAGAVSKNLRSLVVVGPDNSVTPTFVVQAQGNRGVASFNGSVVSYTPNLNQVGTDTFTYRASFGGVNAVGTISVTINALPVEVTASDTTLQTEEEAAAKTINLLPLVTVVNSDSTPVFTIQTQPTRGTATISGSQLSYTPRIGQFGTDTIVYRVTVDGVSDTGTIAVTIDPIVADPIARNDSVTAVADVTTTFTSARLTANDSATRPNLSGQPPLVTAASAISGTTLGTVVFNAANNSVSYTPPSDFIGTDSFRYTMTSEGKTSTAVVTVTVREYVPSTISGTIFTDLIESISNPVRNGVQDSHEISVGGVPVVLTSPAGDNLFGQAINRRVLTNSNGQYLFDDMAPGRYMVTFDMPEDSLIFGSVVNGSGLPANGSGRSFAVEIGVDGGLNYAGLNFTVIGRTGVASATSSLLISQFLRVNPDSPYNINDPAFGSATMVVNPSSGDQRLFELGKGFDGVLFAEIAVGRSSDTAIFTVIMGDGSVKSAILSKEDGDFVISSTGAVIQILRNVNSMSFFQSSDDLLSAEYGNYRDAVDEVLANGIF